MNYGKILCLDTANGPGLRTTLFVSGCRRHCPGCFNPETWDFNYGHPFTLETRVDILMSLNNPNVDGLSILGGEPLDEKNIGDVTALVLFVRNIFPDMSIWVYTGNTWEELIDICYASMNSEKYAYDLSNLLVTIDVLVDGPFVEAEKDISLKFRGSRNQRIIDVPRSLIRDKVVLMEEYM